ncbi:hypothetical protein FRB96_005390 [Tulasnella sp. 330]|nr:hypothetical protein FRB96_005390 [Tulasnella sp. 330]KAG8883018.1 hypothetical protein FRB97_007392 [Tulasnella sp. 331]KAG8888513.1 hypothetical protein FRB98_007554 [Tulasnella sp. 332]
MRSTLLVAFFTLFFASLSFARISGMTAPATVKKGDSFKVTFQTGTFRENVDYTMVLSFSPIPCDSCIGTPAGVFDLVSQGHSLTKPGSFSETIKAPTTQGVYYITAAILYIVAHPDDVSVRFLTNVPITVTS